MDREHGDLSDNEGDFEQAFGSIGAKTCVMPGEMNPYVLPGDSKYEAALMPNARLIPISLGAGPFRRCPARKPGRRQGS